MSCRIHSLMERYPLSFKSSKKSIDYDGSLNVRFHLEQENKTTTQKSITEGDSLLVLTFFINLRKINVSVINNLT